MATGIKQCCSGKMKAVMRLRLTALSAAAGGIALLLDSAAAAAVSGVLLISAAVLVPVYYSALSYTRRGDGIIIERGVIVRRTQYLCRRQVRYVAVRRTLSERMLGLCTLIFVTCAGRVSLPGLRREDALRIRRTFEAHDRG